ncbi:hypothetical protein ACOSP7_001493 [Xanthoceras sorbifolium]
MEPRIVLETPLKEAGERKLALCLVGKILTTKLINRDVFRAIIPKIWRTTQTFIIENVKENVFVFQFQNQADKRRVLMGGPWSFDKCLIVLEEPLGDGKFLDMGFTNVQFWVQLHNVPLVCMTKEIGWALGSKIGRVMDIDVGATGDCLGRFLRVRVVIDITKPLNRYLRVGLSEGDPDTVLLLRYERLTEYCFQCGVVGHVVREFQIANDIGGSSLAPDYKFGVWMRAESPPKARFSRTAAASSTELHKSIQGSTVLRSPSLVALDTGGVSNHPALSHARTTASKETSSSHLVPGSEAYTLSYNSKTVTVLAGAGLVRDAVGSTKSSILHGSTKTSDLHGSTKIGVLQGVAMATRAGSCVALDSGMVGGVKDVVQRDEVESGAVGEGSPLEILGLGAARVVEHSVGHVHGGLPKENVGLALGEGSSPGGSASFVDQGDAHVLGGLSMMNSGLALALDQGGQVTASLVHPVLHPCMALLDGHGCATHVLPKLAVSTDHDNDDHVLPCKVLEHAHLLHCEGKREEKTAANFIFSAHVGASTTVVSPPSMAAMEVDRKPFKWKRFLWGLNIPAKVRMFVWRACRNLLPTRSLLAARRVPVGAGCPLCDAAVESVLHSLWLCRSLVESKAAVPFLASLRLPAAGSFLDFILACFSSLLVHEMELLLVLLWRFWFRRNLAVHSAPLLSVEATVGWSERFLVDFQAAVAVPSVRCELVVERWLAPSPGWVKINSDVAVDVRGRRLGFGVVIRDCSGKVLVSYTSLLLGLFSSDIGEALAILLGLRLAIDMGLSTVCVESDAASVVKQLSSRVTSCSDIGLILDDILSLVVNFADLSFSSVRRSANIVAHGLAKFALSHQPVGVRLGSVPSSLALVVLDDSRGYP